MQYCRLTSCYTVILTKCLKKYMITYSLYYFYRQWHMISAHLCICLEILPLILVFFIQTCSYPNQLFYLLPINSYLFLLLFMQYVIKNSLWKSMKLSCTRIEHKYLATMLLYLILQKANTIQWLSEKGRLVFLFTPMIYALFRYKFIKRLG